MFCAKPPMPVAVNRPSSLQTSPRPRQATKMPLVAPKNATKPNPYKKTKSSLDPIDELKHRITRYSRSNDKRMMLRTLNDCSRLRSISMDPVDARGASTNDWKTLEMETSASFVRINGAAFVRNTKTPHQLAPNKELLQVLKKLCDHLAMNSNEESIRQGFLTSSDEIYHQIIFRLNRTLASADAYFQLNAILGCTDLVVQPPKKSPPIASDLTIYETDGAVHALCVTRHPYGLFRKIDLAPSITHQGARRPWIRLVASVHERINLSTGKSVRYCSVEVQEK